MHGLTSNMFLGYNPANTYLGTSLLEVSSIYFWEDVCRIVVRNYDETCEALPTKHFPTFIHFFPALFFFHLQWNILQESQQSSHILASLTVSPGAYKKIIIIFLKKMNCCRKKKWTALFLPCFTSDHMTTFKHRVPCSRETTPSSTNNYFCPWWEWPCAWMQKYCWWMNFKSFGSSVQFRWASEHQFAVQTLFELSPPTEPAKYCDGKCHKNRLPLQDVQCRGSVWLFPELSTWK